MKLSLILKMMKLMGRLLCIIIGMVILQACSSTRKGPVLNGNFTIIPRTAWKADAAKPYKQHLPVRITVHHEGTMLKETDDAALKIHNIQRWGMGPDRKWADIPYHFLIAPNGTIYEGRDVYTTGETATEYDPTGHLLICCLGNLEEQPLPDAQLQSLIELIAYTSRKYSISPDSLKTHKDYSTQTDCPGKNLYPYFQNGYIKTKVKKLLNRHYHTDHYLNPIPSG